MNFVFEIIIGLEVHVQLNTNSKIFCSCSTKFGAPPNSQTCPICLGLPGVLPVLNKEALEKAIIASCALNCKIYNKSTFSRKNYFYPDLPKAYQISQYEEPLAEKGFVEITINGNVRKIGIKRVHLEEDAGKLIHPDDSQSFSLVDYNRCGIPLIEIVSEPDIHSPAEAYEYLLTLKRILQYIDVSDCSMEEGSLRCDANVSLRKVGSEELGTKVEVKNMNSFKAIKLALQHEIERQKQVLQNGKQIVRETRLWSEHGLKTIPMRWKEEVHDYRYFREPDLPPILIDEEWVKSIKEKLPELPRDKEKRFVEQYGIPKYDAAILTRDKNLASFFEECIKLYPKPKIVSNWMMTELLARLSERDIGIQKSLITPTHLSELLHLIDDGVISAKMGKEIFRETFETGKFPKLIVKERDLHQITDEEELTQVVSKVIKENPKPVMEYREGKRQALGFLVGQVMKLTKGKANPRLVNRILLEEIERH